MNQFLNISKRVNDINMIIYLKNKKTKEIVLEINELLDTQDLVLEVYAYMFDISKTYNLKLTINKILKSDQNTEDKELLKRKIKTSLLDQFTLSKEGFSTANSNPNTKIRNIGFTSGIGFNISFNFQNGFYHEAGSYEFYVLLEGKILAVCPFEIIL